MKTITMFLALCAGATLCTAREINIRGTVVDTSGSGIAGAAVSLERAGLSATTDENGDFVLQGSAATRPAGIVSMTSVPLRLYSGMVEVSLTEAAPVNIDAYDIGGRRVFNSHGMYGAGTHRVRVPSAASGIRLYRIAVGRSGASYFVSPFGAFSHKAATAMSAGNATSLSKATRTTSEDRDVLLIVSEGRLYRRIQIETVDSSGITVGMLPCAGTVTDIDGNVYQSVQIGRQVWTVDNLRVTRLNDSTTIPMVTDDSAWVNQMTPGYCWYDNSNDAAFREKWGALYNWHAIKTGKLAPQGWRVPTVTDFDTLQNYLMTNGFNWDGFIATPPFDHSDNRIAQSMAAQTDWAYSREYGGEPLDAPLGAPGNALADNNRSGLNVLPAGGRGNSFFNLGYYAYLWSAPEPNDTTAVSHTIFYYSAGLSRFKYDRILGGTVPRIGASVRLIREP